MPSSRPYNANRVLNKWEEDRFQRLMANRVHNASSSVNTGKPGPRRKLSKASAHPGGILAKEVRQLEELLQSELQVDPGQEDVASEIQKRLQRVKQIACLTKPQRSASRQLSASSSHRYVAHPESPIHEKGRNAPCVSTSTSAHTTIPTYSGPQHMQEGRPPSHEYSTIPQSFTFYHPQPQQHLSGRHGHSKPRCSNLKPSWDSSFAAEQEDGYVSNVRNRKLLHDHSTSSLQHRQSRRMHALTAAASPGRRPSASHNGIPSLQPGAPHVTAGSHAAFQRVLQRREQRAERRRNTVAAPSQHATPQARQPPRQRRTVHSTGAVHVATVTSAVHPAAGRKAEPRARTRFSSVPAAASGRVHVAAVNSVKREGHGSAQALVSGRQANDRASCAAAVSAGNGSCGGSSSTSASKLYPDERQSGEADATWPDEQGRVHVAPIAPARARPRTPSLKPSYKPSHQDPPPFSAQPSALSGPAVADPVAQAARSSEGDPDAEPDAVHEPAVASAAEATAASARGGGVCNLEDAVRGGSAEGVPGVPEKDDMLERARARVGFQGLPAAFLFDHGVAGAGKPRAARASRSGVLIAGAAGTASGVAGSGAANASATGAAVSKCGCDDAEGDARAGDDSGVANEGDGVREEAAVEQPGEVEGHKTSGCGDSRGGSTSYSTSQVVSDDLNSSFRQAMLQCLAGGDGKVRGKSAASLQNGRGGTAGTDGALKRGGDDGEVATEDRGEIGAGESGCDVDGGREAAPPVCAAGGGAADAAGAACALPVRPGSDAPAGAESKGGGAAGGELVPGMRWGEVAGARQRRESRDEGRVLHTFVAESQESLKSLRTLLNRSREGLRAGPREAALPQHTRLSDHGDAHTQDSAWRAPDNAQQGGVSAALAVPDPGHVSEAAPRQTGFGGDPGVWEGAGRVHQELEEAVEAAGRSDGGGDVMCVDVAGGAMSEASSPARSLVALPAREVHTARANMLILQRQESDGGACEFPVGYGYGRSGEICGADPTGGHHASDGYSSDAASASPDCRSQQGEGAADSLDVGAGGRGVPLQLRHAQAVMGEIVQRYGLDDPGQSCGGAAPHASTDWNAEGTVERDDARGAGTWALVDEAYDEGTVAWQVSREGGEPRCGAAGRRSLVERGAVMRGPCSDTGDSDAAAQLYGSALAGTPVSGEVVGESSMVFVGGGAAVGEDGEEVERDAWGVVLEGSLDGLGAVEDGGEEYGDVEMLQHSLGGEEGVLLFEGLGVDYGEVFDRGVPVDFVGMGQPGVHLVWSEHGLPGGGVGGMPGMATGVYRSAQECTQIELIEDEEDT